MKIFNIYSVCSLSSFYLITSRMLFDAQIVVGIFTASEKTYHPMLFTCCCQLCEVSSDLASVCSLLLFLRYLRVLPVSLEIAFQKHWVQEGGEQHSTMVSILVSGPSYPSFNPHIPRIFFRGKQLLMWPRLIDSTLGQMKIGNSGLLILIEPMASSKKTFQKHCRLVLQNSLVFH